MSGCVVAWAVCGHVHLQPQDRQKKALAARVTVPQARGLEYQILNSIWVYQMTRQQPDAPQSTRAFPKWRSKESLPGRDLQKVRTFRHPVITLKRRKSG